RMGLYRRLNELEESREIEAFAAELIDRFGPLPDATENLIRVIEIKLNARRACIAKMDVGPRGVLVSFHDDTPPNVPGLLAYVDRLNGVAKLRPDSKLVLQRAWPDAKSRLHGALQLSKGLAKAAG
ncbi:MAG: TRCF domain-containing protein, partial [Sphingomonas sp.]